jgi:TatD DNase family protein
LKLAREPELVYRLRDRLYVNLTSRCDLRCRFCFKYQPREDFHGHALVMPASSEPTVDEVDERIASQPPFRELVFCGLGEPLKRLPAVQELARRHRRRGGSPVRVNTSGTYLLEGTVDELEGLARWVDTVSISLNAPTRSAFNALCRPYRPREAFASVVSFLEVAPRLFRHVVATAVAVPGVDLAACRDLAAAHDVPFAIRAYESAERPSAAGPPAARLWLPCGRSQGA